MRKTFILSDGSRVNNHGFRIQLSGLNLDRFKQNPVMLYQHDMERVIGRWENIRIEDNKLLAEAVFDTGDTLGAEVARKVEEGFIKGCSLGLIIEEMVQVGEEWMAIRGEVYEASVVSIPSDAGAVVLYDEKRQVLSAEALYLQFNINQTNNTMDEKMKELEAQLAEKDQRVQELEAQVENLENQLNEVKQERVNSMLSAAVADGRITEQEREHFANLAAQDFASVEQLLNMKPKTAPKSLAATLHQAVEAKNDREQWSFLEWTKKDPAGLKKMKQEQPERYASLVGE